MEKIKNTTNDKASIEFRSKLLFIVLTLILGFRIVSYFTLFPDSVGITRVVKIGLRFSLTGVSFLLLAWLYLSMKNIKFYYTNITSAILYGFYVLLGVASIAWTTHLGFTLLQLLMLFECIAFVFAFYHLQVLYNFASNQHAPYEKLLSIGIGLISLGFLIGLWIAPETFYRGTHGGTVHRLGGFIINPNELGMLAVIGVAMNYLRLFNDKGKLANLIFLILNVSVLLLTQSRSSLGAFLLVTGLFILKSKNYKLQVATVVAGFFVLPILVNTIILKQGDVEEVMSMTGRLPFWSDLITYGFPERPILGYGFMSISPSPFSDKFDSIHSYAASMTHNTFVQVLINLGLVGMFIVIWQMVATIFAMIKSKNADLQILAFAMFIPLFINSLTEFGIFGEANYGIMFYQFIIAFFVVNSCYVEKKMLLKY